MEQEDVFNSDTVVFMPRRDQLEYLTAQVETMQRQIALLNVFVAGQNLTNKLMQAQLTLGRMTK